MNFDTLAAARHSIHRFILEEAAGRKIPELNEPGWQQTNSSLDDLTGLDRNEVNGQARKYFYTDPTAKWMVQLRHAYTFSRGVSVKAADPDIDAWIQAFWNHPRNRESLTRAKAQWRLSRDLQLDGELFFIFFASTLDGKVTVRRIPPAQITRIIYAEGDSEMPLGYVWAQPQKSGSPKEISLPDYRYIDLKNDATMILGGTPQTEIAVMHVLGNDLGGRGISDLATSIPWIKALKGFMEDRATLTLALATFAFRQKIRGNRQALQRAAAQWGDYETALRYGNGDGKERRQGANTLLENEASSLEQLQTDSGASQAYQDMRMFRQQAGIGAGTFEHYLGDPSTGNLATATAMELPMLKSYEYGQEFISDTFNEILDYVIYQGVRFGSLRNKAVIDVDTSNPKANLWLLDPTEGTDLNTEVVFPPIVQKDIAVWTNALAQVASAEAASGEQILPAKQKAQTMLRILGYGEEANAILEEMEKAGFALPKPPEPEPAPPGEESPLPPAIEEALRRVVKQIKEVAPGKALPKNEAEKVGAITKAEVEKAFEEWADMPSLEALAQKLGVTVEELDKL